MAFSDLGLGPDILHAVADAGYTEPTPIQAQAIPVMLMGRDVLGCAQTGTGKTASFVLPMIEILAAGRAKARMPRSLIIEPTRELAAQVAESFKVYGKYHSLTTALLIGGTSFTEQQRLLGRGVDVLIATPGRLIDLFERGKILLSDVKILVIDEADRMLDMGFIPDVERIVSLLPRMRQTLFFSATMPTEIRRLADAFLMNPKEISVSPPASPAETVEHALAVVPAREKRTALRALVASQDVKSALIFCNRKRDIASVVRDLSTHGLPAAGLHGDMPQSARMETLNAFKRGEIRLLVASDVAARGLDIGGLSHVFNFDVPMSPEDYIHRIGRTGRAGRKGNAFMLATPADEKYVAAIARLIGRDIARVDLPGIKAVTEEEAAEATAGDKRRRGRARGPSRSKAPDRTRHNRPEPTPKPAAEPTPEPASAAAPAPSRTRREQPAPAAEAPAAEAPPPAPSRTRREQPAPAAAPEAPRRGRKRAAAARPEKRSPKGEAPHGLGDDIPSFLQNPLPLPDKR